MLDVDSTNNEFFQKKENTIILNERRIWAVESLSSRRRKLDILSNSTKTSDLQKVKFLDTPAIFTNLLHNCDIRNRTTIEKQFSIGVLLILPGIIITTIETSRSHKQEEDV